MSHSYVSSHILKEEALFLTRRKKEKEKEKKILFVAKLKEGLREGLQNYYFLETMETT